MKIESAELKSLNRKSIKVDVKCDKNDGLSILSEFYNLQELQIRAFKGRNLSFLKALPDLKKLTLENVVTDNELEDLKNLSGLEELAIQTPVGWDGSGKKIEYRTLEPLGGLHSLKELRLLDIIVAESGFRPILGLKNLKKVVTNNTFTTHEFAELNICRPDIECEYAKAYRIREIEYFKCTKCGAYKFEFSGNDLKRRTFCPNCNKKKVEELIQRFQEIEREIKADNPVH